jgi:hypothetical protein
MSEIIAVKPKHIQILGIVVTTVFGVFILFVYATAPRSILELRTRAGETVSKAINTGQVITGTYQVNEAKFQRGLNLFRDQEYPTARAVFEEADPERRDGRTQFYIAYSFYRQGWGRFSSDDELFKRGLETAKHAQTLLSAEFVSGDADLKLKTPAALVNELEEGLRVTADDFNPLRALNERK